MLRKFFNKLVRDEMVRFLAQKNIIAIIHQLSASEFDIELRKKIVEEVSELLEVKTKAGKLNELADIFELLSVFIQINGLSEEKSLKKNTIAEAYIFQDIKGNFIRFAQELSEAKTKVDMLNKLVNLLDLLNGFIFVNELLNNEVVEVQDNKRLERGSFNKGVYLEYTDEWVNSIKQ